MKYPCDGCIIDMMCRDPCGELIFFSDDLNSTTILYEFINTRERLARFDVCILKYASGGARRTKIYSKVTNMLREKKFEQWRNE